MDYRLNKIAINKQTNYYYRKVDQRSPICVFSADPLEEELHADPFLWHTVRHYISTNTSDNKKIIIIIQSIDVYD